MSRRKQKRYHSQVATRKQQYNSPELQEAYRQFMSELTKAKEQQQGIPDFAIDVAKAAQVIATHPQLASTLDAIRQRQNATKDAISTYSSPTGTSPQAENLNGSRWAGDINEPSAVPNAKMLRRWADENEWVRAGINIRRKQVEGMHPMCVPIDPKKRFDRKSQFKIQALLDQPNELRDSWRTLAGPTLEDMLVLDRGAILKNMTLAREPVGLYAEDGSCIRIYPNWSGDPKEPRYLYVSPDGKKKKALRNDECICIIDNSANYRYGLSPIQILQKTIEADIEATAQAAQFVGKKPPPNAIQIPKASSNMIKDIAANYESKIAGKKGTFFFGGPEIAHLFPLVWSAKENQWLEWQTYLARKISIILMLSPQKFGFMNDVNRANAEVQNDIDEDRGLIPLLLLIEEYFNREFLSDFAPKMADDKTNLEAMNLKIIFPEVTEAARRMHLKESTSIINGAMPDIPFMTPNMALGMIGEAPMPKGGDSLYVKTATGVVEILSYDTEFDPRNPPTPQPSTLQDQQDNQQSDDTQENSNDTNQEDGSGGKGSGNGKKKYFYFDARMPGMAWRPEHDVFIEINKSSNGKKKIPDDLKQGITKSPDISHAEVALQNAISKVFSDAAKRGNVATV